MAIVNRDKDVSEQKDIYIHNSNSAVATGATLLLAVLPYPCSIDSMRVAAFGVSSAMQVQLNILRFAGGLTVIGCGISNLILQNFGTSGLQGYSGLAVPGSTLLQAQAGDILSLQTSVSNGNATSLSVEIVVKKLQDVVSYNGSST